MTFNRFSDSKVYKIISINPENKMTYYGSTTSNLSSRFNMHKASYKHWLKDETRPQSSLYKYFKEFGVENFKIELVSKIDCTSHKELLTMERFHTDNNEFVINQNTPIRTAEEMREIKRLNSKKYYKENRVKHIEVVKKRYHEKKKLLNAVGIDEPSE